MLVVDHNREILEELTDVAADELEPRVLALQQKFGSHVRVLVDGRFVRVSAPRRDDGRAAVRPTATLNVDDGAPAETLIRLAQEMIWQTIERAADAQDRLLGQAADHTQQLIEGNRRLAEHASELQRSYRQKLDGLDYAALEMKLIEQDASARRLSRHITEQTAAEIAASRPGRSGELMDDLVDGATTALECWVRLHAGEGSKDWRS